MTPLTIPNRTQTTGSRILVVEDESDLREATVAYLQLEGLKAVGVGTLGAAERLLKSHDFDVLVLDLGLPDGDARDWLTRRDDLRQGGIIMTTARGERTDRIAGVTAGADCYLVKPVDLDELVGLIRNLLRRLQVDAPVQWTLDKVKWTLVSPQGQTVKLTHSEKVMMELLANCPGQSVARDQVVQALGHNPVLYDPRRLEVLVRRLRNKIRQSLGYPLPLETAYGYGFVFTAPVNTV